MHKLITKSSTKTQKKAPLKAADQVTCPACQYVRKRTDLAPNWQCPNCQVAYVKVSVEHQNAQRQQRKQKRQQHAQRESAAEQQEHAQIGVTGVITGVALIARGVATTCAGVAVSPGAAVVGGLIVAGSIGYLLWRFSGS